MVAFDAQTGAVLWQTAVGLHLNDEVQAIPAGQTITILPGASGGVQTPMALADGVVYVPIVDAAAQFSATGGVSDDTNTGIGEMDALDASTGQILWVSHFNAPDGSATVSGGLVFTATYAGQVLANALPAPLFELRQAVFDLLLGEEPELPKPPVLVALDDTLRDQGVAAALEVYHGLQEQRPNDYAYEAQQFFTVGDILISLNRTPEAQRILAYGIAIDQSAAEGYSLLALLYHKCREEEQARTAVAQALQRDPQDTLALILNAQLSAR